MQSACAIWSVAFPAPKYIFFTLSHKRRDFRKKKNAIDHKIYLDDWRSTKVIKYIFQFSPQLLPETFPVLRINERDMIKHIWFFVSCTPYSCPVLIRFEFSRQILEKY